MEAFNEMREVGLHKEDNMTEKMEDFSDIQYVCLDMYVLDIFQILSLHETISFFFSDVEYILVSNTSAKG